MTTPMRVYLSGGEEKTRKWHETHVTKAALTAFLKKLNPNLVFVRSGEVKYVVYPDHVKGPSPTALATGGTKKKVSAFIAMLEKSASKKASTAKKSSAKKASAKKVSAKKASAKKASAKKASAKKASAKKASAKKASAKKASAKKASAKKASAKRSTAKKSAPKKKASVAKKSASSKKKAAPKKASAAKKSAPSKKKAAPKKKTTAAKKSTAKKAPSKAKKLSKASLLKDAVSVDFVFANITQLRQKLKNHDTTLRIWTPSEAVWKAKKDAPYFYKEFWSELEKSETYTFMPATRLIDFVVTESIDHLNKEGEAALLKGAMLVKPFEFVTQTRK